jgi:epoxyqueuosine reductase
VARQASARDAAADAADDVAADGATAATSDLDRYTQSLLTIVREAGADRVGVTTAEPFVRARAAIDSRIAAGYADEMQFTFRNPLRSTTPTMSVPGARSIIVAARSYFSDDAAGGDSARARDNGTADGESRLGHADAALGVPARVARYARRDNYEPLRDALRAAAARLKRDGHRATVFADDNSMVDREVAWRAGLGWYGKNANLLLEGLGSWFVLGCVVTTAELATTEREVDDGCGACRRCIDSCPTGAIVEPGVVDARRCLAWLVQKPGTFDVAFRDALGTRIYGCDDCQEVCPPSRRGAIDRSERGDRASVDALELLAAPDAEVLRIAGGWYVADRDPRWVRRNALLVVGNSGVVHDEVVSLLARYINGDDALLAEHARWAAGKLGIASLVCDELVP